MFCPKCAAPNGPGSDKEFFDPFYVSEQLAKISNTDKWRQFTMDRPPQKITASGSDFLASMKMILYKRMSPQHLKEMVGIAMQIGDVGRSIDEYIKNGGLYDGIDEEEATAKQKE